MLKTHRWCALSLLMAAAVGCAGEEAGTPPATSAPSTPAAKPGGTEGGAPKGGPAAGTAAPKPEAPPAAKEGAAKPDTLPLEGPKSEAPKSDATGAKLADDELAEVKKLPAADQELALKQLNCPVSGEHLGSMGVPLKVSAEGRSFFLCCKGCEKELKADPKGVIAKLGKK